MFSALFFCAANILANGDFEAMVGKDVAAWSLPAKCATYRVADGVGRNGSRGLVWDDPKGDVYVTSRNRIDVKPGVSYSFAGWIKVDRISGQGAYAALYFDWYSQDGKWIDGCASSFASKVGEWVRVTGKTQNTPENAAYGVLMAYAQKGAKGKAVFDDLSVEPLKEEFLGGMYSSAYRNASAGGKVRFFVEINKFAPEAKLNNLKMSFRLPVGLLKWREIATTVKDGYAMAEIDVSELRIGKSPVQFWVESGGKYVTSKLLHFERFPGKDPRRVRFDEKNRTIVDGKTFFPIGMYAAALTPENIDVLVSGGFNCVMPYHTYRLDVAVLDKCAEKGLMVMPNIKDTLFGERHSWSDVVDPQTGDALVAEQVSRLKDHPAVLAWYSCDESEVSLVPSLRERQRLLEELDPQHPTWMVLYQAPIIRRYMGAFDAIGTDPYPVTDLGQYPNRKDGIKRVTDWTRQTHDGVFFGNRPIWQVPQCFDWAIIKKTEAERLAAPSRAPTHTEVRNMAWQCLAGGANGLVFYAYHELEKMVKRTPMEKSFGAVSKVAKEIRQYERFFLGDETHMLDTGNGDVVARQWRLGGERLIAVVNATDKPQNAKVEGDSFALKPLEVVLKTGKWKAEAVLRDGKPLFRAGLITDTHVGKTKESCKHVKAAWELFAKEKVDLVANIGDIADHHYPDGYKAYRDAVDEVIAFNAGWNPKELYVYAWHDAYDYKGDLNRSVPKYKEAFADTGKYLRANDTFFEMEIGGSAILVFPQMLDAEGYARYEKMVGNAVAKHPGRPVFVFDHIPPQGTVGGGSGDAARRRMLDKYSSVIVVTGHIHGSVQSRKHIWQDGFTVVNCGCMHNWGGSMVGHSVPSRRSYNALIMDVYEDRVVFRRYPDVFNPEEYAPGEPWQVDLPYSASTARYTPQQQIATEKPIAFPSNAKLQLEAVGDPMKVLSVKFPAAVEAPCLYRVDAFAKGADGKKARVLCREMLGDYDIPESKRPRMLSLEIPAAYFDSGVRYDFSVVPHGFFGTEGERLCTSIKMPRKFANPGGRKVYGVENASERLPVLVGWNGVKSVSTCDGEGVYKCNGGIVRLHLPERLWDVPKGTKFRCELDFRIKGGANSSYHVGLACPRPLRYLGRSKTPPGDTGSVRSVIEFSKEHEGQFYDICIEGSAPCSFELKKLSLFQY